MHVRVHVHVHVHVHRARVPRLVGGVRVYVRVHVHVRLRVHVDVHAQAAPLDPDALRAALRGAAHVITHVCLVQCETTSGVLNPVGALARERGRLVGYPSATGP